MAADGDPGVRAPAIVLANRTYRALGATLWLAAAAAGAAGYYDAHARLSGTADTSPGWLATAACLVLAFRALRLGIVVTDQYVVVRSWLRSQRLHRAAVLGARAVPYRGALSPGGGNYLTMLQLILPEDTLDVPAVVGLTRRGRIPALAARFSSPAP
jgi:hypothetical protein